MLVYMCACVCVMYVCMYVCMYVYMCCVCLRVCMRMGECVCTSGGVLDGSRPGPAGIPVEKMTDDVFNYVFLNKEFPVYPPNCGILQATLDKLRLEFDYWCVCMCTCVVCVCACVCA